VPLRVLLRASPGRPVWKGAQNPLQNEVSLPLTVALPGGDTRRPRPPLGHPSRH